MLKYQNVYTFLFVFHLKCVTFARFMQYLNYIAVIKKEKTKRQ